MKLVRITSANARSKHDTSDLDHGTDSSSSFFIGFGFRSIRFAHVPYRFELLVTWLYLFWFTGKLDSEVWFQMRFELKWLYGSEKKKAIVVRIHMDCIDVICGSKNGLWKKAN